MDQPTTLNISLLPKLNLRRPLRFALHLAIVGLTLKGTAFAKPAFNKKERPQALIYHGPGSCLDCPESIAKVLKGMGFKIRYISPGQFTKETFKNAWIYVQPGGTDNIEDTLSALEPSEIQTLKRFVYRGGRYLGVCAGGYLAAQYIDQRKRHEAFGLVAINNINEHLNHQRATVLEVQWRRKQRHLYFQGGPDFGLKAPPRARVVARYKPDGEIAALIASYGKGKVGLIGPHPEADQGWYEKDRVPLPSKYNFDLLIDFIWNLR